MAPVIGNLFAFLVSLVVGGLALFLAAEFVHGDEEDLGFEHAVWTAVIGAVVWALLSWVPLFGGFLALLGWIAVLAVRYPGGLVRASIMGVVAWLAAVVILYVLSFFGVRVFDVFGVPWV